jgi:hypothetical protein
MNIAEALRPKRKELVLAAKKVMEGAFKDTTPSLNKAQLSHLIGVCNEAACIEEIELYIRYQSSREKGDGDGRKGKGAVWDRALARQVIEEANKAIATFTSDEHKVGAWRLYAVYLAREFTYQHAVSKSVLSRQHGEGGRR